MICPIGLGAILEINYQCLALRKCCDLKMLGKGKHMVVCQCQATKFNKISNSQLVVVKRRGQGFPSRESRAESIAIGSA